MFHSIYLRLTVFYVTIIMAVSLFFSVLYYQNNVRELNAGLERQAGVYRRLQPLLPDGLDFTSTITDQVDQAKDDIFWELVEMNVLMFAFASAASYFLAKRTLQPIQDSMEEQVRFTADASHELRTPLTAIRAETEVVLRDKKATGEDLRTQLQSNLEEVGRLERLSSALLTLARFEHGKKEDLHPVSLQKVWNEVGKRVAARAEDHNTELDIPSTKIVVKGTGEMLVELFVILIDNAIKYSDEGRRVELRAWVEGHSVIMTVRDFGHGIPESDLPHIFNRFYRADRSRSQKTEGYGLGLSIAEQIVKRHNGRIDVESKVDEGTCFTIRLPHK